MSRWIAAALLGGLWTTGLSAQELVPRIFWPAPLGTNVVVMGYQYSTGAITGSGQLPIEGESDINGALVSYQRTLQLFGRTANVQFNLPYTWAKMQGTVAGQFASRSYSAWSDASLQFSVNLLGAPSMDRAGFAALRADPRPIVGVALQVWAPTGAYDTDRVINAGSNRWSTKLTVGMIWPLRPKWLLEADVGAKYFGDNTEFSGMTLQQDPIYSAEVHLVRRIRPGFWAALDLNYYDGGNTTVGQVQRDDRQRNSRIGMTVAFPFKGSQVIRGSFSTDIDTTVSGDYDAWTVSYVYIW